jgi:4-amino-4-deoxy-L-arabinose transferase-like glycosyltransferase
MQTTHRIPLIFGIAALLISGSLVNHGLVNSPLPAGPGLTLDESFNIDQGVYLARALAQHGPLLLAPSVAQEVFQSEKVLPDHPPLGRLLLGVAHESTAWLIPGSENTLYNVVAARLGSCFALALMVAVLTSFVQRRYDRATAIATGLMLLGLPPLIGHARLAALETATNLAWVAAIVPLLSWWTGSRPPGALRVFVSGLLWGLLLLTKVQGILLPPAVVIWSLLRFRHRAIWPLLFWGLCGSAVFMIGWPWTWSDPVDRVLQYLGRTTERSTLYCWYSGQRFEDRLVPWHYPTVMLLLSLPAWTVVGLGLRLWRRGFDAAEQLMLLTIAMPLCVFSVPGVPVYDGTRLFLVCFPGMAFLAARGISPLLSALNLSASVGARTTRAAANAQEQPRTTPRRQESGFGIFGNWRSILIVLCLGILPLPWTLQPFAMNQYGLLAGGNRGAAWLGMEAGYWSDALNGDFWKTVPEGATVYVAPVCHQFQLPDIEMLVPVVQQRGIRLIAWDYDPSQRGLLLLIHRLADLRPNLREDPTGSERISEVQMGGVTLVRLIRTD